MSKTFEKYGFDVDSIDNDINSNANIIEDINNIYSVNYDVIWASFPCTYHSRYSFIHGHWKDGKPNSRECLDMCNLHIHTLDLIRNSGCKVWFIENGRGLLRYMNYMQNVGSLFECCYCMYGSEFKKPTDIWSNIKLDIHMCNHNFRHKSFQNSYNYNGVNERSILPEMFCESVVKQTVDYLDKV
jgi:hypothetical protein